MPSYIPQNNGNWKDSKNAGNTEWFPDLDCIPQGSNDPNFPMTFKELIILNYHKLNYHKPLTLKGISPQKRALVKENLLSLASGLKGICFRNNEPDFSPFSIATVKLNTLLDNRYGSKGTMTLADKILAQQLNMEESALRQWINDNQYVWHERQDGYFIDLLCHDIHGNIPHAGGISKNKARIKKIN